MTKSEDSSSFTGGNPSDFISLGHSIRHSGKQVLQSEQFALMKDRGLKMFCRMGVNACDIPHVWILANNALGPFESASSLMERLEPVRSIGNRPLYSSRLARLLPAEKMNEFRRIESIVVTTFPSISGSPFIPHLCAALLLFMESRLAFHVILRLADRVKENKSYLLFTDKFMQWSVFQLTRYIGTPSIEQLKLFRDFILHGGAHVLSDAMLMKRVSPSIHHHGAQIF